MFCLHDQDSQPEARPPACGDENSHLATVDRSVCRQKNAAMDFAARFGMNLAHYRKRARLSQEELGVRASLHRTAVGQLERGERIPRADTVIKLAGSLAIPPELLLEGLQWTPGGTMIGQLSVSEN
jgi:DNA-binding XRE family transcriptional regulator